MRQMCLLDAIYTVWQNVSNTETQFPHGDYYSGIFQCFLFVFQTLLSVSLGESGGRFHSDVDRCSLFHPANSTSSIFTIRMAHLGRGPAVRCAASNNNSNNNNLNNIGGSHTRGAEVLASWHVRGLFFLFRWFALAVNHRASVLTWRCSLHGSIHFRS